MLRTRFQDGYEIFRRGRTRPTDRPTDRRDTGRWNFLSYARSYSTPRTPDLFRSESDARVLLEGSSGRKALSPNEANPSVPPQVRPSLGILSPIHSTVSSPEPGNYRLPSLLLVVLFKPSMCRSETAILKPSVAFNIRRSRVL